MIRLWNHRYFLIAVGLWTGCLSANTASAQMDRIYDQSGSNVSGTVQKTLKQGIQWKKGANTQNMAAGDILKILYEGDPSSLTRGREFALDGQYEQALTELQNIDFDAISREVIKADAAFYLALSHAKQALAGKEKLDEAEKRLIAFASQYNDSWHFYSAAKLLGDLALARNELDKALKYYGVLQAAPTGETKNESQYLRGLVRLKEKNSAAALEAFEAVISADVQTARAARLRSLAKAGKAVALAQGGQFDEGIALTDELVAELNTADIELAARIYNARGAAFEAASDPEGAVMAYLHTHLMFSTQPDAHAEALRQLVELWPLVGKPDRAAEARQELQQRYPAL